MPASTTFLNNRIRQGTLGYILKVFLCVSALLATFSYLNKKNVGSIDEQTQILKPDTLYQKSVVRIEDKNRNVEHSRGEEKIETGEVKNENDENKHENRENKHENRENKQDKGGNTHENNDNKHEHNENNQGNGLKKQENNEQNHGNNKNKQENTLNNKHTEKDEHKPEDNKNKYVLSFGQAPWKDEKLKDWFQDFYKGVAVLRNNGGMRLAHQFAVYTVLRERKPKYVIESGVWMGATTKVIRKILPKALIISIDPMCVHKNSTNHEVYCGKAFKDFKQMGERWKTLDKEDTVILFDDHQSGFLRILQAIEFGFKYIMIEDNYAYGSGDNYSPKQVMTRVDTDKVPFLDNFGKRKVIISKAEHDANRQLFMQAVKTYIEFPPLHKQKTVEWLYKTLKNKDNFTIEDMSQIVPKGVELDVPFNIEYLHYRNMCYLELNKITPAIRAMIASIKQPK